MTGAVMAVGLGLAMLTAMAATPRQGLRSAAVAQAAAAHPQQLDNMARQRLQQRMAAWDALPLEQRLERRARYAAWRALTPSERAQLRAMAVQVSGFDAAREQALRAQFEALDEIARRGWRLGPHAGEGYQALHPLLAYVPPDQREGLLAMLRSLTVEEQTDLAVLVQRTPPQERQALREDLLALPATRRAAWLKKRVAQ